MLLRMVMGDGVWVVLQKSTFNLFWSGQAPGGSECTSEPIDLLPVC